jgi:cytochrome P450
MALRGLSAVAYAGLLWVVYSYASSAIRRRRLRRFAEENGATLPRSSRGKLRSYIFVARRMIDALCGGPDLLDAVTQAFERNGTTFLTGERLITMDPLNIQAILATKFSDFEHGDFRNTQFEALLGKSILTTDGLMWKHSRALFRPVFSRQNINNLQQTEKSVQDLFRALPLVGKQEGRSVEVDMLPMLFRFTIETATEFLLGESIEPQLAAADPSWSPDSKQRSSIATTMAADLSHSGLTFTDAFDQSVNWIFNRLMVAMVPAIRWAIPSRKGRQGVAFLREYTSHYVKLALSAASKIETETDSQKGSAEAHSYDLLAALAESTKDETEIRDQILGLLFAGRNTTASLLAWALCMLSRHPQVLAKLRANILDAFGPYAEGSCPTNIDFASLKACRYLQFVLSETLRLAPVIPVNLRCAVRDTILPRGGGPDAQGPIAVGKGQMVVFVPYSLHRSKDIWGPDTDAFKPERWEGRKLDWNFIAFSGGPRICLGRMCPGTLSLSLQPFPNPHPF